MLHWLQLKKKIEIIKKSLVIKKKSIMQSVSTKPAQDASFKNLVVNKTLVVGKLVASSIAADFIDGNRVRIQGVDLTSSGGGGGGGGGGGSCATLGPVNTIVTIGAGQELQASGSTLLDGVLDLKSNGQVQIDSTTMVAIDLAKTSIALGANAGGTTALASNNVTAGNNAGISLTTGSNNVVLGSNAVVDTIQNQNVVIGNNATARNSQSISIGTNANTGDGTNMIIGNDSSTPFFSTITQNIIVGNSSTVGDQNSTRNILIGNSTSIFVPTNNSISVGNNNLLSNSNSVAIGHSSKVNGDNGICVGVSSQANALNSMALGKSTICSVPNSIQIGANTVSNNATGSNNIVFNGKITENGVNNSIILGNSEAKLNVARCLMLGSGQVANIVESNSIVTSAQPVAVVPGTATHKLRLKIRGQAFYLPLYLVP